jgi:hypothetical protein
VDVNDATESSVGFHLPWAVLAGGFVYQNGQVTPIVNGVMRPAQEILTATAAMLNVRNLSDDAARSAIFASLADQIIANANEMKALSF